MAEAITIVYPHGEVTGLIAGEGTTGVLLAHGAGTNQEHPLIVAVRDGLAARGYLVMTFNYPYTERGSKRPDRQETLIEVHRAAAAVLGARVESLFLAGRSMGGRMATLLVAEGQPASGVILYAYPLHPAGKPDMLRVGHLPAVAIPMLFFQGSRDALARMDLFELHIANLPGVTVEILEGADHSFRGRGWTPEVMVSRLTDVTSGWIDSLSSGRSSESRP